MKCKSASKSAINNCHNLGRTVITNHYGQVILKLIINTIIPPPKRASYGPVLRNLFVSTTVANFAVNVELVKNKLQATGYTCKSTLWT